MSHRTLWRTAVAVAASALLAALAALPQLRTLQAVMLGLVLLVALVTLRFSHRYLDGAPNQGRYLAWFGTTVASASTVVLTDHLVVLALAWMATSLALHQLLLFFAGRTAAEIAAHKKFILSRVADLCIIVAVALLGRTFGSFSLQAILAEAATQSQLPVAVEVAGAFLAFGVILRAAQLPFHGWLIQVMEAPTPISALLHAGIINLGAYLLIATGPLTGRLVVGQTMLVLAGTTTAILASLVLLTQGSVKRALAWSTCAQMGFVLMECGLGAYDLALLHLLAHGLYKANAFLRSGRLTTPQRSKAATQLPSFGRWVAATAVAAVMVGALVTFSWSPEGRPAVLLSAFILTLALIPTLAHVRLDRAGAQTFLLALLLPLGYAVWHTLLAPVVPALPPLAVAPELLIGIGAAFLGLVSVQLLIAMRSPIMHAWYGHALAGFHLDAVFTRLTFRLWPPTVTPPLPESRMARPQLVIERAA